MYDFCDLLVRFAEQEAYPPGSEGPWEITCPI